MRRHLATLTVALAVLVPFAGCSDDGDDVSADGTTTAPAQDPIAGRTFASTATEGAGITPLVDGVPITITFGTDGDLTVDAGCDPITGSYAIEELILVVRDLEGAGSGCSPGLIPQNDWIAENLTYRPVVTVLPPDGLTLSDDEWTLSMTEVGPDGTVDPTDAEAEGPPLVGPTWTLDYLSVGDESPTPIPPEVTPTIVFADDGTYAISAGCNTGTGSYTPPERGKATIEIEPPTLTRERCDDATAEIETAFAAALDGVVSFSIERDRLTLAAPNETGLGFTPG